MFLRYIHLFRGVAILFIVAGHCVRVFNWETSPFMEKICKSLFYNGTVLFVFIAGFLFQHLQHKKSYREYLTAKLKYIILPYVVISLPMVIYLVFIEKMGHWIYPELNSKSVVYQIFWFYLTGKHLAPLWFIPMITLYYFLFPLFVWIDKKENILLVMLPVTILLSAFIHRPQAEINVLHTFLYFLSVYIFGMSVSHYKEILFPLLEKYTYFLLLIFALLFCMEILLYDKTGIVYVKQFFSPKKVMIDINLLQKLVLCCIAVSMLKHREKERESLISKGLSALAAFSFGIYFLHYYYFEAIFRIKRILNFDITGNLFLIFLLTACIVSGCVIVLKVSKVILGKQSRSFVGC